MELNEEINFSQDSSNDQIIKISDEARKLSPEEYQIVLEFAEKIDITNVSYRISYGSTSQQKLSDLSSSLLNEVRTKDLGVEVGNAITEAVTELRHSQKVTEPGLLGSIFGEGKRKITKLKAQFSTAEENIGKITKKLETHQLMLLKDIAFYVQMYEKLEKQYKQLIMYIEAGKIAIDKAREKRRELEKQKNGDFFISQKCNDLDNAI